MTVLEALAILESATLECKKRDIDTPEVKIDELAREYVDTRDPKIREKDLLSGFCLTPAGT
jgi:hypothetical protein